MLLICMGWLVHWVTPSTRSRHWVTPFLASISGWVLDGEIAPFLAALAQPVTELFFHLLDLSSLPFGWLWAKPGIVFSLGLVPVQLEPSQGFPPPVGTTILPTFPAYKSMNRATHLTQHASEASKF